MSRVGAVRLSVQNHNRAVSTNRNPVGIVQYQLLVLSGTRRIGRYLNAARRSFFNVCCTWPLRVFAPFSGRAS